MRIGSISLAAAGACVAWAQTPQAYVDPATCASCHREIAENYARTGMGRSFRSTRAGAALPEFDAGSFDHPVSAQRFTATRREGDYFLRRRETGPDGKDINTLEVRVDYVIGSGDHSRSYLHRTPDNRLVELPASWYAENGGHWEMSPGYDRAGHPGFSREISYRCMFCHNGYPEIGGQAAEWSGGTDFPARLPEGIDCQRCHGPGANHVDAAKRGRPRNAVRAAIVNPARLNPERRLEVCMQCHLETTSASLPGALMKRGRGVFSYRPGEPLENYILYFDYPPGASHEDKVELVSAAYRFRKSACFAASKGQFGCTGCHNPHRAASRAETIQKTQAVCQGCHSASIAKLVRDGRHAASSDCASCHMPQRRAADAIHILVTDHKISRRPTPESPVVIEEYEGRTPPYLGEVKLYYPGKLATTLENELYLAIAQVKQLSNLPEGLRRLEKAIAQSKPDWAGAYFEMGEAFLTSGQPARALPYFEEAARRDPREWRYLYELAQATAQTTQAVGVYQRALALAPGQPTILSALGAAYSEQGNLAAAAAAFRQALLRDPENALVHNNLGNTLLRMGDVAASERALREAVRLRPELASIRINLGAALLDAGKPGDGKFEFEQAIRTGPSLDLARSAWFNALAGNHGVETAKTRYDGSLRTQLAGAHAMLGTALVSLGDRESAIREYRLALAADHGSAATLVNLALTLAARGDRTEARQRLEEALRIAPDLFAAHLKLGEILLSEGQPGLAADHLKRAAESPDERIRRAAQELLSPALTMRDDRGLLAALLGDGRFLLSLTGIALLVSGGFAIFQSISGHFLPHDVQALGMDAAGLARAGNPKIVQFMFHDRVAFGGALIAIGAAYWWLAEFPLGGGSAWAWWTLALSGGCGFLSFLAYLGYGYLDTWHGAATLLLFPVFLAGMWRARRLLAAPLSFSSVWTPSPRSEHRYSAIGRRLLLICGFGLLSAGITIVVVGMTFVFVPQDLVFMGVSVERLRELSPVLIPLIAHDRAGFGGGLFSIGFLLILMMRHAPVTRSFVELIAVMGLAGFGAALGVHAAVGYTDVTHLTPAYLGCLLFAVGEAFLVAGYVTGPGLNGDSALPSPQ